MDGDNTRCTIKARSSDGKEWKEEQVVEQMWNLALEMGEVTTDDGTNSTDGLGKGSITEIVR